MPLIGTRPRQIVAKRHYVTYNPLKLGLALRESFSRAACGRPTSIIRNARASSRRLQYLLSDVFDQTDGAVHLRNFRRLAAADAIGMHMSVMATFRMVGLVFVSGTAALGGLIIYFLTQLHTFTWSLVAIIVAMGMFHSAVVLRGLGRMVSPRAPELRWMLAIWFAGVALAAYASGPESVFYAWKLRPLSIAEQAGVGSAVFAAVTIITYVILFLVTLAIDAVVDNNFIKRRPVTSALFELLWAADLLHRSMGNPIWPGQRWQIVDAINYAAKAVGFGVPRLVPIADVATRRAVQQRLMRASHAINQLGRQVMLGDASMRKSIIAELSSAAAAILTQQHSNLPEIDAAEDATRERELRQDTKARAVSAALQLLLALLPLATVRSVQLTPFQLPQDVASALTTLAAGWFVIKLISILDPSYRQTLADARSAAAEIRPTI